jgi:hypothetical protein
VLQALGLLKVLLKYQAKPHHYFKWAILQHFTKVTADDEE